MDMARSMLAEFKSPLFLWAEAISTACHCSNRLFFRVGKKETPYEMLTGNKPNISYYRVFGCKCFYKIKGVRLGVGPTREKRLHVPIKTGLQCGEHDLMAMSPQSNNWSNRHSM